MLPLSKRGDHGVRRTRLTFAPVLWSHLTFVPATPPMLPD
jgi:hypothetical protein